MLGTKLVLLFPVVMLVLAARIFHFGRVRSGGRPPPRSPWSSSPRVIVATASVTASAGCGTRGRCRSGTAPRASWQASTPPSPSPSRHQAPGGHTRQQARPPLPRRQRPVRRRAGPAFPDLLQIKLCCCCSPTADSRSSVGRDSERNSPTAADPPTAGSEVRSKVLLCIFLL